MPMPMPLVEKKVAPKLVERDRVFHVSFVFRQGEHVPSMPVNAVN